MNDLDYLANAWVTYPRPNPDAHLRLFCFPYAGGSASIFYPWLDDMPPEIEVCPIQLPGRDSRLREASFSHLEPLLDALVPSILPSLGKPFAFFGHSMGATLSFELARRLRRQSGLLPIRLFVSGSRAPQVPDPSPPIYHLPDEQFAEAIYRFNGTPEAVIQNAELMALFMPILRADIAVIETHKYTPDKPLDCPISAFGGQEDKETIYNDLVAWQKQTSVAFTLRMLPGDHFFLRSARSLLIQAISQDLVRTLNAIPGGVK